MGKNLVYQLSPPMPRSIDIEVTTRCNLACVMCQRTYWSRPSMDMGIDLFQRVLQQIPTLQSIKLHGIGEPVLNPRLFEMIQIAKQGGLFVWTYSNGTLLHVANWTDRLLLSGLDLLRISMDGANAKSYEQIRVGANWNRVVENIRYLVHRRDMLGLAMKIELWMVGMRSNISEISDLVDVGAKLGVDAVRVQMVANTFSYKLEVGDKLNNIHLMNGNDVESYLQAAKDRSRQLNITFEAEIGKQHSENNHCPWPFSRSFISADGLVVPCGSIADPSTISFGSVTDKEFGDIWGSDAYQVFRESHLTSEIPTYCLRCYNKVTRIKKNELG